MKNWIPIHEIKECYHEESVFDSVPVQREDAVTIALDIERVIAPLGAHTALTGSCLYRGESKKDVDIVVYPHNADDPPAKMDLLNALHEQLELGIVNKKGWWHCDTTREYVDKEVSIIFIRGVRIDIFFLLNIQ